MDGKSATAQQDDTVDLRLADPYLASLLAWALPGAGHLLLGRWQRSIGFFVLVLATLLLGCQLEGRLPWVWSGAPLQMAATLGALGGGVPVLLLRFAFGYEGTITAAGYEYGGAFILTAGMMNLLLVLDAWDIAVGRKT